MRTTHLASYVSPLICGLAVGASLVACAPSAYSQTITYGPIIGRGFTGDSMIVRWGTQNAADSTQVSFKAKGAASYTVTTGSASKDHEVVIKGLAPGQVYEYFVTSGMKSSATFQFSSCPTPGRPMDMVFYGDSRSVPSAHAKVVAQIIKQAPEMIFESGDIAPEGIYNQYLMEFFPVAKDLVATTSFMAAPGNHDWGLGLFMVKDNYARVFPAPRPDGAMWQPYYSFTCGNAMFLSLNSNDITGAEQKTFINDQLRLARADSSIDHVLVFFHHGAYSPGSHGDSATVQKEWVPLFNQPDSKVTAVFSGHDHIYARMRDTSNVFYVVSGGAGANLYSDNKASKATKVVSKSAYNFVSVHLAGLVFSAVAYDENGTELDRFTITKPMTPAPVSDGGTSDGGVVDMGTSTGDDMAMMPPPPPPPPEEGGCTMSTSARRADATAVPASLLGLLGLGALAAMRRRARRLANRLAPQAS